VNVPLPPRVETARLVLRAWEPSDLPAFAALNADPGVMELLGGPLSHEQTAGFLTRIETSWSSRGYGLYAAELRATRAFAGFIGLANHRALADEVEIGWRLARSAWGQGLATEGALAVRDLAYSRLGLRQLVSITTSENVRSIRVMEKLGFAYWQTLPFEAGRALRIYRHLSDTPSHATTGAG
jgi:RimJ/RimL family protein N-acetyltransferase